MPSNTGAYFSYRRGTPGGLVSESPKYPTTLLEVLGIHKNSSVKPKKESYCVEKTILKIAYEIDGKTQIGIRNLALFICTRKLSYCA